MKPTREEALKGVRDGLVALHEAIEELSRTTAQLVTIDVAALDEAGLCRLLSALKSVDDCLSLELLGSATAQALTVGLLPPHPFACSVCGELGAGMVDGKHLACSLPAGITNLGGQS